MTNVNVPLTTDFYVPTATSRPVVLDSPDCVYPSDSTIASGANSLTFLMTHLHLLQVIAMAVCYHISHRPLLFLRITDSHVTLYIIDDSYVTRYNIRDSHVTDKKPVTATSWNVTSMTTIKIL